MGNKKPHKHAELIKAWADGAEIQYYIPKPQDVWIDTIVPSWDESWEYRLKPNSIKPEYIPFTWEDRDLIKARWIKKKDGTVENFIHSVAITPQGILYINSRTSVEALQNFVFLDGSPCGKLK